MNGNKNGFSWCACFYVCGIMETYGQDLGMKLLYLPKESLAAGCGKNEAQAYYSNKGKLFKAPQIGDQVFFGTQHTGAVVEVSGNRFWTIEGNTSGGNTIIANGGGVHKKGPYTVQSNYTFGRPDWKLIDNNYKEPINYNASLIKENDYGPDVIELQEQLIKLGYDLGMSGADGDFGPKTTAAVKDFQKKNNLTPDGIVGPLTSEVINKAIQEMEDNVLKRGDSGEKVKTLQIKLNSLGFAEVGAPDGGFGVNTELAVKNFQENYDITVDGVAGPETQNAINACLDTLNDGVFGIDVSTYQKTMKFANTPAKFVILRAGYTSRSTGLCNKDTAFESLYEQAKSQGLNVGVYWYSLALSAEQAIEEAKYLYENCLKGKKFELPIYLDVEEKAQLAIGKAGLTALIQTWLTYLTDRNYCVGVYTSASTFNTYIDTSQLDCEFWVAQWAKKCTSSLDYGMWQFGGEINKLRKPELDNMVCDQDLMLKDYPTLIKARKQNGYGPAPSPIDSDIMKPYTAIVIADLLNVRTSPSLTSSRVGVLKKNSPVKILEVKNDWGKINYRGKIRWILITYTKKK